MERIEISRNNNVSSNILLPKTFKSPRYQSFPLPRDAIYYITKNVRTAKVYQKLVQTCKYFYSKTPIIFADEVIICKNNCWFKFAGKQTKYPLTYINKFSSKFWLIRLVMIFSRDFFLNNLYRNTFDCYALGINLSRDFIPFETIIHANKIRGLKHVCIHHTLIKYADGSNVSVEKVFELFPNVEIFNFTNENSSLFTPETAKTIMRCPNFKNLTTFTLGYISEAFDFKKFSYAMKVS